MIFTCDMVRFPDVLCNETIIISEFGNIIRISRRCFESAVNMMLLEIRLLCKIFVSVIYSLLPIVSGIAMWQN